MISWRTPRTPPIGLHLGVRTVALAQTISTGRQIRVQALASGELPLNENLPPEEQDQQTAAALQKLLASQPFRGRQVVSCLGGQEMFVQNVRLPQLPADEIGKVVRWEAEERLPYPVADAEIRHLVAGEVRQDANVRQEVILMACHRGVIERQLRVLELAGLEAMRLDAEPCATIRCLRAGRESDQGMERFAYLCLGERTTSIILAENEQILFLKYVLSGGYQLDRAVAKHLSLPLEEAGRLRAKVTFASDLDASDEIHRSVIEAIRLPLEAICSELELCLRYFKVTFRGRKLDGMRLTGCEASSWLAEFLTERLGLPCKMANPLQDLDATGCPQALDQPSGMWTTAIGLSLPVRQPASHHSVLEPELTT